MGRLILGFISGRTISSVPKGLEDFCFRTRFSRHFESLGTRISRKCKTNHVVHAPPFGAWLGKHKLAGHSDNVFEQLSDDLERTDISWRPNSRSIIIWTDSDVGTGLFFPNIRPHL